MSDKQLAVSNTEVVIGSYTQKELDTLKATIAKGTTNEQFALFMQTCVSSGLNPFLNQIYCIVYDGQKGPVMSMQIAVEGIVALAKKHPQYKGFIASEVKEQDEFEIDMVTGEPIHKIKGLGNRGKTLGAFCVAYREGMPNISVVVDLDQVSHLINSSVANTKKMWTDYRDDMLVKHAIKRAFKRQFGIEVAEDEAPSSDSSQPYERKEINLDAEPNITEEKQPKDQGKGKNKPDPKNVVDVETTPVVDEVTERKALNKEIRTKYASLGITKDDEIGAHMAANMTVDEGQKPTLEQMKALLEVIEAEIAAKNDVLPE